jgi:hypothetical protein
VAHEDEMLEASLADGSQSSSIRQG